MINTLSPVVQERGYISVLIILGIITYFVPSLRPVFTLLFGWIEVIIKNFKLNDYLTSSLLYAIISIALTFSGVEITKKTDKKIWGISTMLVGLIGFFASCVLK